MIQIQQRNIQKRQESTTLPKTKTLKVGLSMKSLLNKILDVLQPKQILLVVFCAHVFMQDVGCNGFNPSNLEIFVESLLQVFVQITGAKEEEKKIR